MHRCLARNFLVLFSCAIFFTIVSSSSNKTGSLADIPIKVILKDIKDIANSAKKRESSKTEFKRTIVGVKKHKNYEIVLYEYSDEDLGSPTKEENDFIDTDSPTKSENQSEINETSSISPTENLITSNKPPLFVVSTTESTDIEVDNASEDTDSPFVWGQREGLRSGKRRHKIILLKGRNPTTSSSSSSSPSTVEQEQEEEEEDDNQNIYSNRGGIRHFEQNQRFPSSSSTTTSTSRTTTFRTRHPIIINHRKQIEDAPGAGRWIPRKKLPSLYSSLSNLSRTFSDEERDNEYDEEDDENERVTFCKDPNGKPGICEEYFKCSVHYLHNVAQTDLQDYKCKLGSTNEIGICCPVYEEQSVDLRVGGQQAGRSLMKLNDTRKPLTRQIKNLLRSNVNNSIAFGIDSLAQLEEIEEDLFRKGGEVILGSPAFGHNRFLNSQPLSSKKIRQVSEFGFELLQTTNDLSERLQLTDEVGGVGLKSFKSRQINDRCPRLAPCGINKYRLIDGSCNNLIRPKMGQSLTPLSRVLEPAYADQRWEPRVSVRGFLLPSARLLSQRFIKDADNPNTKYTLFTMQFGQFIDHDISSVPIFTFANGTGISCCKNGNFLPPQERHPNCLPIEIPSDDPFYSRFGQRCMNFIRSRMAPRVDCSLGYADQMNAVTHWLDLSNVYGSSETEMRELRLFDGGLLQFSELADRRILLPLKRKNNGEIDYKAGDDRVNEMQGLMVMHLIWLREHNRVAAELQTINPFWNDEQVFQEARRIVIAEYQHILYSEWLPIIVGREYMESYRILPLSRKSFFKSYDPDIDASIENAFSAAGFRMGHTLVQGLVRLINEFGQSNEAITISNHAENAVRTRSPNQIDRWIRGLAQQPIQSFDNFISHHLNGRLFQARGGLYGMDLSALNIQRSRDHGVPGYNAFRELCQTGKRAKSFSEFTDWISPEVVDEMRRIYDHPDDVDLWIGGISEQPLKGALIGPTFTCIVGDQFARTKKGDRYFYDIGDQTHSFSPDQLQEIRKASMARILCDNGDELEALQPSVFLQSDFDFNSLVDCKRSRRIPRINLQLWTNEPTP